METLRNEGTDLPLSLNTTVEDILNFQKSQTQTFLRVNHIKVSDNKLELAQRVVKAIHVQDCSCTTLSQIPPRWSCQTSDVPRPVPDIKDLHSGWADKSDMFPKIKIQDVENYWSTVAKGLSMQIKMLYFNKAGVYEQWRSHFFTPRKRVARVLQGIN